MGRLILVGRLVLGDLRRHPAAAVIMVVSIAVAATMLSLGVSLSGASERLYLQTREATAGPDVVTLGEGAGADTTRTLKALADAPGVAATSPVRSQYFTEITVLVVGGWLLALLAVIGMTTLTAGRAAQQVRRVGLLKAVGATPGVILAVLLLEHVGLALLADLIGLGVARLLAPELVRPSASFLTTGAGPTGRAVLVTTMAALLVGVLTTLRPTLRALRTETVKALTVGGRPPAYHPWLTPVTALLPVPVMLGIRLIARRPGRAVLHAFGTAGTATALGALAMVFARPLEHWNLGPATVTDLMDTQVRHVTLGIAVALVVVAVINTLTITWTTAAEARASMAVTQALGATPGQITAGLSAAQLLPTLPGAFAGVPVGVGLYLLLGPPTVVMPPLWRVAGIPVVILAVTAALTAVPARLSTRRPIADTLSLETA